MNIWLFFFLKRAPSQSWICHVLIRLKERLAAHFALSGASSRCLQQQMTGRWGSCPPPRRLIPGWIEADQCSYLVSQHWSDTSNTGGQLSNQPFQLRGSKSLQKKNPPSSQCIFYIDYTCITCTSCCLCTFFSTEKTFAICITLASCFHYLLRPS